jgi:hypothetical protein
MSPRIKDHEGNDVTHGRETVDGVRLHCMSAGAGDPVFLLHGVPKTSYHWRHVIPLLTPHYTVIAPDLRGLGDSQHPKDGYDMRNMAELFGEGFRSLSEERQDRILSDMEAAAPVDEEAVEEKNSTAAFEPPDDEPSELGMQQTLTELDLGFFELLAFHTRQGFYSDPIYGGNKDRVGWEVIGFPGPESLAEVHSGRFSTLPYFAEKEG